MLQWYSLIYAVVSVVVLWVKAADDRPLLPVFGYLLGAYIALALLWLALARYIDAFTDGMASQFARNVNDSVRARGLREADLTAASLAGVGVALGFVGGLPEYATVLCAALCASALVCTAVMTRQEEDESEVEPLPTIPQPDFNDPERTEMRQYDWVFTTNPMWDERERVFCEAALDLVEYEERRALPRLTVADIERWGIEYVRKGRGPSPADLAYRLREMSRSRNLSRLQEAVLALSFAQGAIEYAYDKDTTALSDYPRYPVESLGDTVGDCEDKAILAACLLMYLERDVVLLDLPGHVALGIALDDMPLPHGQATSVQHQGRTYYFCEATAEGAWIGWAPSSLSATPRPLPV